MAYVADEKAQREAEGKKMMRAKPFSILAIVTIVSVAIAAWSVFERNQATASRPPPGGLFPRLIDQVNQIEHIDVQTPKLSFSINRTEAGQWQVKERNGYPVKFETIKQAVVGIANTRLLETKTAKPDLHDRLFLKSPKEGGRGTIITLGDGSGKTIAAIIVGKTKSSPTKSEDGIHYVRRLDEDQSYLASGRIEVWETIDRWLDNTMPTINRKRVRAATTIQPDGSRAGVSRHDPEDRDFKIIDIPKGMKPLHDTAGNALGSALGFLGFEDVRPASKVDFTGANKAIFKTFDGVSIELTIKKEEDHYWLQIITGFDAADVMLDGLTPEKIKKMKNIEDAKGEVTKFNKRFSAWAYRIPEYKAKDFMTGAEQLFIKDDGKS